MRYVEHIRASLGLFAIIALVSLSFVSTLSLSPIVEENTSGQVAGLTSDPVNMFLIKDANDQREDFFTEIANPQSNQYAYNVQLTRALSGEALLPAVLITNPTEYPVDIVLSARSVPAGLEVELVGDSAIYDLLMDNVRIDPVITVPPQTTVSYSLRLLPEVTIPSGKQLEVTLKRDN